MNTILSHGVRSTAAIATAMLACAAGAPALARGIVIDGFFDDWADTTPVSTDPAGDASGPYDLTRVFVRTEGTNIFLRFDASEDVNIQAGPAGAPTIRVEVVLPTGDTLVADCRNRTFRRLPAGTLLPWSTLSYVAGPTYAARDFEIRLDLAGVGVTNGQTVSINFSGSDSLAAPIVLTLDQPLPGEARRSAARSPLGTFRIASINTELTGLTHPTRAPMLARLVDAMNADIYCFQEEYNSSLPAVQSFVQQTDPLETGVAWRAHKFNECAIVTWGAILPMPTYSGDYAAAVCDLGGAAGAVAIISFHPACCGWAGSTQDTNRITETRSVLRTIADLRAGRLGLAFEPYVDAPIVLVGDWNLVGSRIPLDLAEQPHTKGGAGLTWFVLRNLIGADAQSWRDPASDFAPGILDLLTYSADILSPIHGFLLDTARLDATELAEMNLLATDSSASDHLMLVADFARLTPACPGDVNLDGTVTISDLGLIIVNWGALGIPGQLAGDADGSGGIDMADIDAVVARWGTTCAGG